jgi:hypothetical protein
MGERYELTLAKFVLPSCLPRCRGNRLGTLYCRVADSSAVALGWSRTRDVTRDAGRGRRAAFELSEECRGRTGTRVKRVAVRASR